MLTDMSDGNTGGKTKEGHNYTEAVGTRLSPETKRRLEDYKEEHEVSNSEALRRLVREGLDAEDNIDRGPLTTGLLTAGIIGLIVSAGGNLEPAGTVVAVVTTAIGIAVYFTEYQI
jgi:hypothetical protein